MKKSILSSLFVFFISICMAQSSDPVLMTVAGKSIKKSDFEYIWNKNRSNSNTEKVSMDDYIDLFINFKLKVAEAESMGFDTTKAFKDELNGYRSQLAAPYLTDKAVEDSLIMVLYERKKEFVEVSHIMINCELGSTPEDTLIAYKKIMSIFDDLNKGKDFAEIAKVSSQDNSRANGGYMGVAVGMRMIFPFENVMYTTPVGTYSNPFRTPYGYHIVMVNNRVPAWGRYRSAHIMKAFPANATDVQKAAVKDSIAQIYKALQNGESFSDLAKLHSDDKGASVTGEYPLLYCGTLPIDYESNVFQIKEGAYSQPFMTVDGWHIVKALEFLPYPNVEEMREEISSYIQSNPYTKEFLKNKLSEKFRSADNFQLDMSVFSKLVSANTSARVNKDSSSLKTLISANPSLFKLMNKSYDLKYFISYLNNTPGSSNDLFQAIDNCSKSLALTLENNFLEFKYPEFGKLMQEYKDGMLLFEVSNREVWEKAANDDKGLKSFFESNKSKYNWEKPHYKGVLISCANGEIAKKAKKAIKGVAIDSVASVLRRAFTNDTTSLLMVEKVLVVEGENAKVDNLVFGKADVPEDKLYPVTFVQGTILKKGPESYDDVRGLVVTDYQVALEKAWISQLRKKYKFNVVKEVLSTVNKN